MIHRESWIQTISAFITKMRKTQVIHHLLDLDQIHRYVVKYCFKMCAQVSLFYLVFHKIVADLIGIIRKNGYP
jgi:hypothetical protein